MVFSINGCINSYCRYCMYCRWVSLCKNIFQHKADSNNHNTSDNGETMAKDACFELNFIFSKKSRPTIHTIPTIQSKSREVVRSI